MNNSSEMLAFPHLNIHARQFESGANIAANEKGITVVIDVFRASNTMLELLVSGAEVVPVTHVRDALDSKYNDFIKVGEDEGETLGEFDYDNSPVLIYENREKFENKQVVIRTTNGTRGIIASFGSHKIVVGTFLNFSAVLDYCVSKHKEGYPISFIAMGTLEVRRIEDDYCANMFVIKMLEKLGKEDLISKINENEKNPWLRSWTQEIMEIRGNTTKINDYNFSLQMDKVDIVPVYNQDTGFLEIEQK